MTAQPSFLTRLARDRRGNTIGIMAASLIPMLGLAGSAVDMSRLYVVKVRLQQACDAGVLAGRKFMTGTGSVLDDAAEAQARKFFGNNFQNGWMKTTATSFTPTKTSASRVAGTANTTVPMTIMAFFGYGNKPLSVQCEARFDVADTDVIFVLDTTGSMACLPADSDADCSSYVNGAGNNSYTRPADSDQNRSVAGYAGTNAYSVPEKSGSRMAALRAAVLKFYDTFDRIKDPSTRVRYGFVTYASSVNAGRAIRDVIPSALVGSASGDTANYQSRRVSADYVISTSDAENGKTSTQCSAFQATRVPAASLTYDTANGQAVKTSNVWANSKCYTRTENLGPRWEYKQLPFDVTGVVAGNVVTNPTKVRGQTMRWLGCVETQVDTPGQTTFVKTAPPSDIDPDARPSKPGSSGIDKRWIPQMQDLAYLRNGDWQSGADYYTDGDEGFWSNAKGKFLSYVYGSDPYATALYNGSRYTSDAEHLQKGGFVACGKPVKRITAMTRAEVNSWITSADFAPIGGTYHDVGMIWGARLISPTGPWSGDTQPIAGRNLNRVIVFLTDGDMAPTTSSYSLYGLEGYDRRVTNGAFGDITANHNRRFLAACDAAKAKGIDIWTVAIDTAKQGPLETCATNKTQSDATTDAAALGDLFEKIAKKLAMLRLTV